MNDWQRTPPSIPEDCRTRSRPAAGRPDGGIERHIRRRQRAQPKRSITESVYRAGEALLFGQEGMAEIVYFLETFDGKVFVFPRRPVRCSGLQSTACMLGETIVDRKFGCDRIIKTRIRALAER
jgi:hypothetical protein